MADFRAILNGSPFTFQIGPDKESFHIHSEIISRNSKVLDKLMNNGTMNESVNRIASLDDTDPETFVQFAEYAYSGIFPCTQTHVETETDEIPIEELPRRLHASGLSKYYCSGCGGGPYRILKSHFPRCSAFCSESYTRCVACDNTMDDSVVQGEVLCQRCAERFDIKVRITNTLDSQLWIIFKKQEFRAMGMTHKELQAHSQTGQSKDEIFRGDLLSHAKLYVFADRYDVLPLRDLCLHKMHRDLLTFRLENETVLDFLELMEYTWANTLGKADEDVEMVGSAWDLRDLIISYAACNAEILNNSQEFHTLLRGGGDVISDYINALTGRL